MSDQITSNVLVVDDDCVSLHLVSSILAPHYDVHTADCARIAIQNIQYHRYDIIILDVEMPDTNGFQLCKLIRATNLNGGAPIIFISSSDKPEDKVAGFRSGCDDYITKPFISDEIICRIKNHVEHYHLKTALETKVFERTVALSDEIERRRVAEIQYKKLFTAIIQSPLSIMIVGTNGHIEYVNPQFTRTTGYTPDESIGRNPRFLKSGYTLPEEYDVMWGCITSGNIWTGVFCTLCKDLSELWENVTIAPVADDNNIITHYIAIKENITKQKKIENEFLATKEIAKSAERAKESFIQMISHELRTPLNSIIGFADLISMEPYGPLGDPRYQEYSKRISESGRRHLEMIKQLIDLSLLSAGRYTVSDDLFAIEEAINFALKSALQNDKSICHNITLDINGSPLIRGDQKVFEHALSNLILNAAVFTPEEGRVVISINCGWRGSLVVTISDNGPGMSDSDLKRVLEPFTQVDDILTRSVNGLGLGLPLSKLMFELHGCSLKLESYAGRGTNVIIRIPKDRIISM